MAGVLTAAASAYQANAVELSAVWQDQRIPMIWAAIAGELDLAAWKFCARIAALRPGRLWRYAQAGDLPGYGAAIDGTLLQALVAANTASASSPSPTSRCSAMMLSSSRTGI